MKMSIKQAIYQICPICAWRCRSNKRAMREHMKYQHHKFGNQLKFIKPK